MKQFSSPRFIVLGTLACCALAAPKFAIAQPEAPVADAARPKKGKQTGKPKGEKKQRAKMLMPRVVQATETAMGKPLTPELKAQLTAAMRDRDAAVKAANDAYYAAFAQATGLTPEQAKAIDKPGRGGALGAKAPTKPKAEVVTDMDELTKTENAGDAPVTPK